MFALVRADLGGSGERVPLETGLFDHGDRQAAWFRLDNALEDVARSAADAGEPPPDNESDSEGDRAAALAAIARRARSLRDGLAIVAEQRQRNHVYWGEVRPTATILTASPIEVGELMRRHVLEAGPTTIFTSATLAAGGSFAYTRARLGLQDADELLVDSPFDYASQAMLYAPRDLPHVGEGFTAEAAARTRELIALTRGRAFVLFTSHRALREASALLGELGYPRLVQGEAPRAALVERFRGLGNAVLLGTASFWEGVDVPGDALSLVVIDKLPFAPHTDPLVAARMRLAAEAGLDPFEHVQLPAAAIALKQGFGRLIRCRTDQGIVAVLDGRLVSRGYGRAFFTTLPATLGRTSSIEQLRRWWAARTVAP
jgi:ATP-dependent DNA helicase DinG